MRAIHGMNCVYDYGGLSSRQKWGSDRNFPEGVRVDVKLAHETVWLTQKQMAELFDTERSHHKTFKQYIFFR
jgi:hypothetical protein